MTNFESTLPNIDGDLARQMTKGPYSFDFLVLREECDEKELKSALIASVEHFLLELGKGFACMGRKYLLDLVEEEEFCDMLFFWLDLVPALCSASQNCADAVGTIFFFT